jgi:hypothetical protein
MNCCPLNVYCTYFWFLVRSSFFAICNNSSRKPSIYSCNLCWKVPVPRHVRKNSLDQVSILNTTVQTSSGDIGSYHEAHLYSLSLGWNVSQIVQNFALFVASLTGEEDVSFLADIESCDQGETEAACRVVTSIRGDCCDTSLQRRFPRLQTSNLQSKFLPGVLLLGSM